MSKTIKEQVDELLDDRAMLLYGVKYEALQPIQRSNVLAEAVAKFDPRLVDLADSMERPGR